jgi:hypothetical protein
VAEFGLTNAVYEAGDTFLEVVSPARDGTTAGRYLERRGGDAGYMALIQVDDTRATRARARELGLRTVWQLDLDDISGTHLHPRDMHGAIVSFDTPIPAASWRWGGPRWIGGVPPDPIGPAITGMMVRVPDPDATSRLWADVFGAVPGLAFEQGDEGIVGVTLSHLDTATTICGVTFTSAG